MNTQYVGGYEDLIQKNDAFKAEKLKFGETIMVMKDQNIGLMKKVNGL